MSDWRKLSRQQLAHDTIVRAADVDGLTSRSWETMGYAWLGIVPLSLVAPLILIAFADPTSFSTESLCFIAFLSLAAAAIAVFAALPWWRSISACRRFTAEMNERKKALLSTPPPLHRRPYIRTEVEA